MARKMLGKKWVLTTVAGCVLAACAGPCMAQADDATFAYFDTVDVDAPPEGIPVIRPWRVVKLDPEYGGQWVVAGDVDHDGKADIVSSENFNQDDVHYTTTAVAQDLDGTILWRWGTPRLGRKSWHHDVACQIHDWDGDGRNEVVLCTKGALVELDGATGTERRRITLAADATDCLVFCNLSGDSYASDVLVKDRYHQIWAYNVEGQLLWTVRDPGGYRTAHQPRPMDIDGDGRDEVMAGYAMLNADGSVRWVFQSQAVDQRRGHLDCARVLKRGRSPEAWRIVLTCCGANNVALVDGDGRVRWERSGHHFESVDVGRVIPGHAGPQILVDIDHRPYGKSPLWVLDEKGRSLGQIVTNYSRHHCLLDVDGDGFDEILVAHDGGLYDHRGRRIATFGTPGLERNEGKPSFEKSLLAGDMTGDGAPDVLLATPDAVYIYKNDRATKPDRPAPLGTGANFTLY